MRKCPICGTLFKERKSSHEKVYCSRKCQSRGVSIRAAERKKAARHAARKMKVCPECGKEFLQTSANKVYCSRKCGNKTNHRASRERRIASGWIPRKRKVSCLRKAGAKPQCSTGHEKLEKVRAYLDLPASERWSRRNELTRDELKLAERMFNKRGVV